MAEKPAQPENVDKAKEAEMPTRRVRVIMVNPTDFMSLFTKGLRFRKNFQIIEGIPEDAELIGAAYDVRMDGILLVVESEEFEAIPINIVPPVQPLSINVLGLKGKGYTKKANTPKRKQK